MSKFIVMFLFFYCSAIPVSAQEKSRNVVLLNTAGNGITIGSPLTVTNNTVLFPGTLGAQGALLYISSVASTTGSTTWLNPTTNGFVLSLNSGLPAWTDPATLFSGSYWSISGNPPAAAYNGTSGSFLGTTNTQPLVIATTNTTTPQPIQLFTNNMERARIASTGELLVGTTTPISTATVNGETYSNTFLTQTNTAKPAYSEGRLFYDSTEKTMAYYNDHNGVTLNVGQEEWVRVYNASGSSIINGSAVYINGANSIAGLPTIALAKTDNITTSDAIGVTTETIPNNSLGYVTAFGVIHQLNTASFTAGQVLYVSATTAGALTTTRPSLPNFVNPIGFVETSDATLGKILIIAGKTRAGALTQGAVAFGGSDGYVKQNVAQFFWDSTNSRLGIGTNVPNTSLDVARDFATRELNYASSFANGSTTNDLSFDGLTPANQTSSVRLAAAAGSFTITGFAGGQDGKWLTISNRTGQSITLANLTGSSSANQILTGSGANVTLTANAVADLKYSATDTKWILISVGGSAASAWSGTAGQLLESGGAGTNPSFQSAPIGIYGDGSDGAITFDGSTTILGVAPVGGTTYTLNRDIFPSAMTVNSGIIVIANGTRIYCTGTITNNGTIHNNGGNASNNTAGAATSIVNVLGNGQAGAVGGSAGAGGNTVATANAGGGSGGVGGISGGGQAGGTVGGAVAPVALKGGASAYHSFFCANTGMLLNAASVLLTGGSGGSGGGGSAATNGGGGGGGGGVLLINAWKINNTSGTISANGGNGGNGTGANGGSGGGGGGGLVLLIYHSYTGNAATATKGAAGTVKTGTGVLGSAGSDGHVVSIQN